MGKLIISESEKNQIRRIYGLLKEQTVVKRISIQGKQPINNTDWDLVHGILGSKRLTDDLEQRVGDELKKGDYRVNEVYVSSRKLDNNIITDGVVDLVTPAVNELPHKIFTTRGSIGIDYVQRHDTQINGLEERLKDYYKGNVKVFGPYEVDVEGTPFKFKQTFYAIEGK